VNFSDFKKDRNAIRQREDQQWSQQIIIIAQQPSIKPLDVDLTDYQYPFPVRFISLNIQGEDLKMAYMDVKPPNPNGHVVMLLHGKNFNGA
jgi:hypothetical protein